MTRYKDPHAKCMAIVVEDTANRVRWLKAEIKATTKRLAELLIELGKLDPSCRTPQINP